MKVVGLLLPLSIVIVLSLAASFGLFYFLASKSSLNLGNGNQIDLSSSASARLWGLLLGLSAGGFSVGSFLAPDNQPVRALFASFGGDWFLLITAALVLIGLVGGLFAKHPVQGALASGWASLILAFVGIVLTAVDFPNYVSNLNLPSGQLAQLLSTLEISQLLGGCFAALITGLMGALGGRALQYREKVPIDFVKSPEITPVEPMTVGQAEETIEQTEDAANPVTIVQPYEDTSQETYSDLEVEDKVMTNGESPIIHETTPDQPTSTEPGARGPFNRPPPCPHCGTPLSWIPEANRYYCKVCAIYP